MRRWPTTASISSLVELTRPQAIRIGEDSVELEVLQVDTFGNVQLSCDASLASELRLSAGRLVAVRLDAPGARIVRAPVGETFGDVAPGEGLLLIDSDGYLSLSINRGDAG
jgi:hypothetical protein